MEITEIGLLLVKAEGTYGTDAAPTGVNAIPTVKDTITYDVKSTAVDRKLTDGTLDSLPGYNASPYVDLKFSYELRGNRTGGSDISSGSSANAVEIDALLQAADLVPVYNTSAVPGPAGVTYAPSPASRATAVAIASNYGLAATTTIDGLCVGQSYTWTKGANEVSLNYGGATITVSGTFVATQASALMTGTGGGASVTASLVRQPSQGASVTAYWYTGLKLHKLTGGKVDVKITLEAGKMPVAEFTVTGMYSAVTDVSLPTPTFLATKPPLVDGSTITINSFAPVLTKMEFSLGNRIAVRKSAGTAGGIAGVVITGYDAKGTMDPETTSVAAEDFWGQWKASTLNVISAVVGSQSGNTVALFVNDGEYKKVDYANNQNIRVHQASFNMVKNDLTAAAGYPFQLRFS